MFHLLNIKNYAALFYITKNIKIVHLTELIELQTGLN